MEALGSRCGLARQHDYKNPNRVLVIQVSEDRSEAKVFRASALPQGMCVIRHATALKPFSFKTVISTAPSSTL